MFNSINRAQLIDKIAEKQDRLQSEDIKLAVQYSFDYLSQEMSLGNRIEIRGFGTFSLHYKKARTMRSPKTGKVVDVSGRNIPHFKPSSIVNKSLNETNFKQVNSVAEEINNED